MLHQYLLLSDENDRFRLSIELNADTTFEDLQDFINKTLGYTPDSFNAFYICDEGWEPRAEVLPSEFMEDNDLEQYDISRTTLEELIFDKGQQLQFLFDPLQNRVLYMHLTGMHSGSSAAPQIIEHKGKAPKLSSIDDMLSDLDTLVASGSTTGSIGLDEVFYGDQEYNADELSDDGFDIVDEL